MDWKWNVIKYWLFFYNLHLLLLSFSKNFAINSLEASEHNYIENKTNIFGMIRLCFDGAYRKSENILLANFGWHCQLYFVNEEIESDEQFTKDWKNWITNWFEILLCNWMNKKNRTFKKKWKQFFVRSFELLEF